MTNQEIVDGFLTNDKRIVLVVYEQLFPKIQKWIHSYHSDEDDARNTIWKSFAVLRQKCKNKGFQIDNVEGYIFRTAQYLWFQEIRRRKKDMMTHHLDNHKIEDVNEVVENTGRDMKWESDKEEVIHQFQHRLKKLPILCQQIILLKYQYKLPHEDIAARYNTSIVGSRKRLSRCSEQLATIIQQGDFYHDLAQHYPDVIRYIQKYLKKSK